MKKLLIPGFALLLFLLIAYLVSGCSVLRYMDGSTPEQIEQFQHPILSLKIAKIGVQESVTQRQIDEQRREVIQIREVHANIGRPTAIIQGQVKALTETVDVPAAEAQPADIAANAGRKSLMKRVALLEEEYMRMRTGRNVEGAENQLKVSGAAAPGVATTGMAAPTPDSYRRPTLINSVRYDSEGYDKIIIALDREKIPAIFSIEGNKPQIVIDFTHTTLGKGVPINMATKGIYIQGVRVGKHLKPVQKTRIMLDMAKDKKYLVDKAFFQKETLYVLTIKPNWGS